MKNTLFFMYRYRTFTAPVQPFLKVISKILFFNITEKFTNLLAQLSIFLIDLFVGTYRLSSHVRLEAFVIQTKLNLIFKKVAPLAYTVATAQLFLYTF